MQTTENVKTGKQSGTTQSQPLSAEVTSTLVTGKAPLSPNPSDLASMVSELQSKYSFGDQASSDVHSKSRTLDAIETTFHFSPATTDIDYKWLYIEPLLNQAANILDRCLAARNERDELAIQKFNLERDLEEFFGTYAIYNREIEAGLYTIPYERAVYESLAESEAETYVDAARREIGKIIDRVTPDYEQEKQFRYWGMLLPETSYPGYPTGAKDYTGQFGPYKGNKWEIAVQILPHLSEFEFSKEMQILYAQYSSYRATGGASAFRKRAMDLMAEWNHKDIDFKRERKELALRIACKRAEQASTDDGVLNYAVRKSRVEQQFGLGFREALARLFAVQDGMKIVYGYADADGVRLAEKSTLDEAVLWTRKAINWLVRFSQLEQNYVLPLSVGNLSTQWKDGKTEITFEVTEELFKNQRNVRLRGVGAAVIGANINGTWQIVVKVPRSSRTHLLEGNIVEMDQSIVPPCFLGRVANRYGFRDSDIVGINALHNASPLGTWTVSIGSHSVEGIPTRKLSDLQIDLHLAVRTV